MLIVLMTASKLHSRFILATLPSMAIALALALGYTHHTMVTEHCVVVQLLQLNLSFGLTFFRRNASGREDTRMNEEQIMD